MNKKKLLSLSLALALSLSLAACGAKEEAPAQTPGRRNAGGNPRRNRHLKGSRLPHSPRRDLGAVRAHFGRAGH